jgi:hypothetical protein
MTQDLDTQPYVVRAPAGVQVVGGGLQGDLVASCSSAGQAPGAMVTAAALLLPVRPKVEVGHAVSDDAVECDQDVVTGDADRLRTAPTRPDLGVMAAG